MLSSRCLLVVGWPCTCTIGSKSRFSLETLEGGDFILLFVIVDGAGSLFPWFCAVPLPTVFCKMTFWTTLASRSVWSSFAADDGCGSWILLLLLPLLSPSFLIRVCFADLLSLLFECCPFLTFFLGEVNDVDATSLIFEMSEFELSKAVAWDDCRDEVLVVTLLLVAVEGEDRAALRPDSNSSLSLLGSDWLWLSNLPNSFIVVRHDVRDSIAWAGGRFCSFCILLNAFDTIIASEARSIPIPVFSIASKICSIVISESVGFRVG